MAIFRYCQGGFCEACFSVGMIDKLLYYIIALEALFSERKKSISAQLTTMLARVLGRNEDEEEIIKDKFEQLYSFRCDIVHGSQMQKSLYSGHIIQAHEFVRRALIWFLHYLNDADARLPVHLPLRHISREHLLKKLGLPAEKIWGVPPGFPRVQEWMQWIE